MAVTGAARAQTRVNEDGDRGTHHSVSGPLSKGRPTGSWKPQTGLSSLEAGSLNSDGTLAGPVPSGGLGRGDLLHPLSQLLGAASPCLCLRAASPTGSCDTPGPFRVHTAPFYKHGTWIRTHPNPL